MSEFEVRPWHWWIPFLMGLTGGFFQHAGASPALYVIPYVCTFSLILWFFYWTYKTMQYAGDDAEAQKFKEYHHLSPEEKAELGYRKIPEHVQIRRKFYDPSGGLRQIKYDWIPYPAKFQQFIRAALRGAKTSFTEWEGGGKLYSDGQFEQTMDKLIGLGYFVKNGEATNSPRVITDEGIHFAVEYLNETLPGQEIEIAPEYAERLDAFETKLATEEQNAISG